MYQTMTQDFSKVNVITFMSENEDRLQTFNLYGGWRTIEEWTNLTSKDEFDVKSCFNTLKKYSLLREYERKGYDTSFIRSHSRFDYLNANDVYKAVRGQVDKIKTRIMGDSEIEILNQKISSLVDSCLERPDYGFKIPFPILNEAFMGMQQKTIMALAALSNAGKSRLMIFLVAYATLVLKQKTLVLLNEMTVEKMRKALLTTVVNNPEFQKLHHVVINKPEREIVMGIYRDKYGNVLNRKKNDDGQYIETQEEYVERIKNCSFEYQQIKKISDWLEKQTDALMYVKDISSDYSNEALEYEIRSAVITKGVKLWFYDTCKNEQTGEWSAFKITVSRLSELCKPLNVFGYLSMQLNDETNNIDPENMSSSCIAEAKQTKHVLDSLIMIKEIDKSKYDRYVYSTVNPDWGSVDEANLNPKKRYYAFIVDKNRGGEKPKLLFEVDLNRNIWRECGTLKRARR